MSELFDRFSALVHECGPVTVYAQKTRIVFQVRVRFTGVTARKHWLEGTVWLKRRVDSERFYRIDSLTPHDHVHYFRLKEFAEIDQELREIVQEAYSIGCQEYINA